MDSPTTIENQTPKEKPVVITSSGTKKPIFKFSFVNPKILGAMTVLLLLVGGVGAGVYLAQTPTQTTSRASLTGVDISFKPAQTQTTAGSQFNIDVFANAADNQINSIDLNFKYDPTILTLKSITPGQFLPRVLTPPNIQTDQASISLGTDTTPAASGTGVIATLIFEAKPASSSATTQITFNKQTTKINVLNRTENSPADSLGQAEVTINPSASTPIPKSTSSPLNSPSATNSAEVSDFNNDGLTNAIDLSIMYAAWGDPETDIQKKADLNHDNKVNGMDYSVFIPKFTR